MKKLKVMKKMKSTDHFALVTQPTIGNRPKVSFLSFKGDETEG